VVAVEACLRYHCNISTAGLLMQVAEKVARQPSCNSAACLLSPVSSNKLQRPPLLQFICLLVGLYLYSTLLIFAIPSLLATLVLFASSSCCCLLLFACDACLVCFIDVLLFACDAFLVCFIDVLLFACDACLVCFIDVLLFACDAYLVCFIVVLLFVAVCLYRLSCLLHRRAAVCCLLVLLVLFASSLCCCVAVLLCCCLLVTLVLFALFVLLFTCDACLVCFIVVLLFAVCLCRNQISVRSGKDNGKAGKTFQFDCVLGEESQQVNKGHFTIFPCLACVYISPDQSALGVNLDVPK